MTERSEKPPAWLRKIRWWFQNPDNFPVKTVRLGRRAVQVFRDEGPKPFFQAIPRKLLFWIGIHPKGFTSPNPFRSIKSLTHLSQSGHNHYDVIVMPIIDWDFRFQRPQQLADQFARHGHRVFYFSTTFHEGNKLVVREIQPNLYEVALPGPRELSLYNQSMTDDQCNRFVQSCIQLADQAEIDSAVILVDLPFWQPLAFALRAELDWKVVYDCMDSHADFPDTQEAMLAHEETLVKASDWVLASSGPLYKRIHRSTQRVSLVPNAGEYEHFAQNNSDVPAELANLKGVVIGYYGAISTWFDAEIIQYLASQRTEWNFVLIGNTQGADLASIENLPNVFLLGEKPYSDLPAYLKRFDVAIIPFKKTPLTDATNPVKLFEYLSAGKPVVASDLEELNQYKDYVRLANTPPDWLQACEQALRATDAGQVQARQAFARMNTWEARFEFVKNILRQTFPSVSILIITYNNWAYTRLCLESILQKTAYPAYEIIIVDNASQDETLEYLKEFSAQHPEHTVIFNNKNVGFAAANNQASQVAKGEFLLFLNNDTVVTPGWLNRLLLPLRDPEVGMVGPATNWAGNESRIPVPYKDLTEMETFARSYTSKNRDKRVEQSMIAFFCVAIRASTWQQVGDLDERFGIGMFEDDDYGMRIRQAGLKVLCTHAAFVHHWGRTSFSKIDQQKYKRLFEENRQKFEEKWNITWQDPVKNSH